MIVNGVLAIDLLHINIIILQVCSLGAICGVALLMYVEGRKH